MQINAVLKEFGFNNKEIEVFLTLVQLGPSAVRTIAQKSGVNRGTTYEILKQFIKQGIVSYFDKNVHQYFVAEPPERLLELINEKERILIETKALLEEHLPKLKSVYRNQGGKPTVKLYEGTKGIKTILEDVLSVMNKVKEKEYYVYSSADLRKNVHKSMPDFSKRRIRLGIRVKTIALGEGGKTVGLDERKWMRYSGEIKSTYEIIYNNKVAHISLDDTENPVGVVIECEPIYQTQKMIFESNWRTL